MSVDRKSELSLTKGNNNKNHFAFPNSFLSVSGVSVAVITSSPGVLVNLECVSGCKTLCNNEDLCSCLRMGSEALETWPEVQAATSLFQHLHGNCQGRSLLSKQRLCQILNLSLPGPAPLYYIYIIFFNYFFFSFLDL